MTEILYHRTHAGMRLCGVSAGLCSYDADEHFTSERLSNDQRKNLPLLAEVNREQAKYLGLHGEEFTKHLLRTDNWGAQVSATIAKHIETTNVVPSEIELMLSWEDESLNSDPKLLRHYFLMSTSRFDKHLNKTTNIYQLTFWDPNYDKQQKAIDHLFAAYNSERGLEKVQWSKFPSAMKWEAGFGEEVPIPDVNKNSYVDESNKQRFMREVNKSEFRQVLDKANVVDIVDLENKLTNPYQVEIAKQQDANTGKTLTLDNYTSSVKRRAHNIVAMIQAIENTLMGPYDAYDRGISFYHVDGDRKTIINENLHDTIVRGHHLRKLGSDSFDWLKMQWPADKRKEKYEVTTNQERFVRVLDSVNKGIPHQSPMTFWTTSTPDGSRWELGLDVMTPANGSHRVRFYDAANPNIVSWEVIPTDAAEGFALMKSAMEDKYGPSSKWSYAFQQEIVALADIVSGHRTMSYSAKFAHDHMLSYGVGVSKPRPEAKKGILGKLMNY